MEKKLFKSIVELFIIFAILALIVTHFSYVMLGVSKFFTSIKPLLIAIAIAFILRIFQKKIYVLLLKIKTMTAFKSKIKDDGKFKSACKFLSIVLTYVLVFGVAIMLISIIIPNTVSSLGRLYENFDKYKENMNGMVKSLEDVAKNLNLNFEKMRQNLNSLPEQISDAFGDIILKLYNFTFDIIGFVMTLVLGIILSIYMLAGAETISIAWHKFLQAYVKPQPRRSIIRITNTIEDVFSSFVVGQLLEAIILGSLCFIGMLIFRFEYAPLISTMIGAMSIIPLIGAFIGAGVACLLLLIISPMKALAFIIFFVMLQQFEGNVIYPKVVGNSIGLPAMLVLVAILIGGSLFGIIGTVLAVPIMAIAFRLLKADMESRNNK